MTEIKGTPASDGYAAGPVYYLKKREPVIRKGTSLSAQQEIERFAGAKEKVRQDLKEAGERTEKKVGSEEAEIFLMHQMLLDDEEFVGRIEAGIRLGVSAEYAVQTEGSALAEEFAALDDAYMSARAADFRDVSERLVCRLCGVEEQNPPEMPVILAAEDLTPGETIRFASGNLLGIVTQKGSMMSHSAILARNLGIPAVVAAKALQPGIGGDAIIDGAAGIMYMNPDEELVEKYREMMAEYHRIREKRSTFRMLPGRTADGHAIEIACNIGGPDDVPVVTEQGGESIGLLRSEFLFLGRDTMPSEEEQANAYGKVLRAMGNRRVVVRTLDAGADKKIPYLNQQQEENPALGCRAIRISLRRPEIFLTQLRALLRASKQGKLNIMFPLITAPEEVAGALEMLEQAKQGLRSEKVPFDEAVQVGVMVETPAAALRSGELAKMVNFFSIGTNDLTQYTLAVDRMNGELGAMFNAASPAVLSLIRMTVENAHRNGIWVGICGESAANEALLPFYIGIGVDELSVSPMKVLELKDAVSRLSWEECRKAQG